MKISHHDSIGHTKFIFAPKLKLMWIWCQVDASHTNICEHCISRSSAFFILFELRGRSMQGLLFFVWGQRVLGMQALWFCFYTNKVLSWSSKSSIFWVFMWIFRAKIKGWKRMVGTHGALENIAWVWSKASLILVCKLSCKFNRCNLEATIQKP